MDLDWGVPSRALYKRMIIVSFLRLVLGLFKRGYLLILMFAILIIQRLQLVRGWDPVNRLNHTSLLAVSLTGLNAKTSGDNLCREHRHKLSPGDNSCCRQFMPATIHAANISMDCRRRRFMPRASAWIVAGDNSCRATIHAVTWRLIHLELIWGRVIKGQFSQDFGLEHTIF